MANTWMQVEHIYYIIRVSCPKPNLISYRLECILFIYIVISEGQWIRCDQVFIGRDVFRGNYEWFDTPNFSLPEGSTVSFIVRLCIQIAGIIILL